MSTKKKKRQMLQLREDCIAQLYHECMSVKEINKWSTFELIFEQLQKVIDVEQDLSKFNPVSNREENLNAFLEWLHKNGVDTSNFEICPFETVGWGLKASRSLESNECFLTVPLSLIITSETIATSPSLGSLVNHDQLLRSMPSVAMALFLLNERFESKWTPYINILPSEFSTPLYFTRDDLNRLKPSSAFCDVLTHIHRITRQYCYLHNLFKNQSSLAKLAEHFSFDAYRWAVSAVSTRQNNILDDNGTPQLALIPVMDFLNHQYGPTCIHYNPTCKQIECATMKSIEINEQIFMFYGKRTNAEYLIHNGFVPNEPNPHDTYVLRLVLPKTDEVFEQKIQLLERYGMEISHKFVLFVDEQLLNPAIFIFIKIFLMDSPDDITNVLSTNMTMDEFFTMHTLDRDNDVRTFLKTRLQLLLRSLNISSSINDPIACLLISERENLTRALDKLALPF